MKDILFKTDDYVFSYRVAGILVHNGCVLLQRPDDDPGLAFPGGHVAFGETNAQTLKREFMEEIGADIEVGELKWVAEVFFPWGNKRCHQICLYYIVHLRANSIPLSGSFRGVEMLENHKTKLGFYWTDIDSIDALEVYPTDSKALIKDLSGGVRHFVYTE